MAHQSQLGPGLREHRGDRTRQQQQLEPLIEDHAEQEQDSFVSDRGGDSTTDAQDRGFFRRIMAGMTPSTTPIVDQPHAESSTFSPYTGADDAEFGVVEPPTAVPPRSPTLRRAG
ncbi:hypothetical protein HGRIS_010978 [Hohenbuehelia grisea]|uniref:Uncharacterized protein n=1 Tax=Hohenbuehelia grisea TaxID=104357 RepID=A0ABR3IYL3_9AGAR